MPSLRKPFVPLAAVLSLAASACGAAPMAGTTATVSAATAPAPASKQELTATLKRLSQEFSDASASGDAAAYERLLDDNVAFMDESGETGSKKDLVEGQRSSPPPSGVKNTLVQTDFEVKFHGSVAVTTFTDEATVAFHGQTLHAKFRSTEVWLNEGDAWRMISSQTMAASDDPPAVTLPGKVLDEYVGTYMAGDDFVFKIARDGDGLTGTVGDGKPFPLRAELRDVLFVPGQPRLRRIFQRDASGKITGFVSRREGHDIVLRRVG